jgi:MoaA/NifB/PqqE/SkfB family radical SAM enzyme
MSYKKYFNTNNYIKKSVRFFKTFLLKVKRHVHFNKLIRKYGFIGDSIRLDATSRCQLKCPICATASGKIDKSIIGTGFLRIENFTQFIDRNPTINNVELSNWGELFLNPHLIKILKYAFNKGVSLTASNGVNLNNVKEKTLEALVKYKFKRMSISIDGATPEIYKIYRIGGDLNTVINNIKIINQYKKEYNSTFPQLGWQFVIFGHNEHQIGLAKKMAKELNMSFNPKLNFSKNYSPIKNRDLITQETNLTALTRKEYVQKMKKKFGKTCEQLWLNPQVNWDGTLLGCCINKDVSFGNVFKDDLEKCLKSERYQYTKKMLLDKKKARVDIPCTTCNQYKNILKVGFNKIDIIDKYYLKKPI